MPIICSHIRSGAGNTKTDVKKDGEAQPQDDDDAPLAKASSSGLAGPNVVVMSEDEATYGDLIKNLPLDCRPVPGSRGAHCYTVILPAGQKVTVRVRDHIFYITKARQEQIDAAKAAFPGLDCQFTVDAKGGCTVI